MEIDLGSVLASAISSGAERPMLELSPDDAARQLRDAYDVLTPQHHFERRQIIRRKRGLYTGTKDYAGGVAIFLRYGVPSPSAPMSADIGLDNPAPLYETDCFIGCLNPEGAMMEFAACSRYFEPFNG